MRNSIVFWSSLGIVALGVWKLIQPSVAGYTGDRVAYWSDIIGGALVIAFGLISALVPGPGATLWRTIRKGDPTLAIMAIGLYGLIASFADYYDDIGRVETFAVMALSMGLLVLGLLVTRSRLTEYLRERRPRGGRSSARRTRGRTTPDDSAPRGRVAAATAASGRSSRRRLDLK